MSGGGAGWRHWHRFLSKMGNVICPCAGFAKSIDAYLRNALIASIQHYTGELILQELEGRLGSQTPRRPNIIR